jgi:uncharacterized protein (TIGR03083 family)
MSLDSIEALRRERDEFIRFCGQLTDAEWRAGSACEGWRIQDVVAHLGGAMHSLFTPASLKLVLSKDIERTNDEFVEARYPSSPAEVFSEYQVWSARMVRMGGLVARTPLARVALPLGELGRFPLGQVLGGALTFDQHTHLRHDMAPALGRPVPGTDELRMATVLGWMFSVLSNQLRPAVPAWLDRPLAITLDGPGGGTWRVGADGQVPPGVASDAAARITGTALEFPSWGTSRTPWRQHDVKIDGDEEYAVTFLDALNIV